MIQIKRGSSAGWKKLDKPLAAGQPGYDKDRNKIKIGDGKTKWSDLPYASGLCAEEIFSSEALAKQRHNADSANTTLITYGKETPSKDTIGQLYLQYSGSDSEVDHIISFGTDDGWFYQKWNSGFATASKVIELTTSVQSAIDDSGIYQNSTVIKPLNYPITFKTAPSEVATVQSSGGLVWLASSKGLNTKTKTASYSILSADMLTNNTVFRISIRVEGFWK